MAYRMLTGSTGLLGDYLLRDGLLANQAIAVLVRPERQFNATARVEAAVAGWETRLGRTLPRPVVLEGDICSPALGLSPADQRWVASHCRSVVHSGASIKFHTDASGGDPYHTNVDGTRNLLGLCRAAGIREFHHISTAYVHGRCDGLACEQPATGTSFRNDYEQSKYQAECLVLSADFLESITIYRPSIIVGDSQTSYTSTFHGFYTPLRLGYELARRLPTQIPDPATFRKLLEVHGHERKNLVPVDWVSAVISHIVNHPQQHGRIYHVTHPKPVPAREIETAMTEVMISWVMQRLPNQIASAVPLPSLDGFRDQMRLYEDYFSDDPTFDSTQTQHAVPHLPVPELGHAVLKRLSQYAVDQKFATPRPAKSQELDVGGCLNAVGGFGSAQTPRNGSAHTAVRLNLEVTGPGGGDWQIEHGAHGLVTSHGRSIGNDAASVRMNSNTFLTLLQDAAALTPALHQGHIYIEGSRRAATDAAWVLELLFRLIREKSDRNSDRPGGGGGGEGLAPAASVRSGVHV